MYIFLIVRNNKSPQNILLAYFYNVKITLNHEIPLKYFSKLGNKIG